MRSRGFCVHNAEILGLRRDNHGIAEIERSLVGVSSLENTAWSPGSENFTDAQHVGSCWVIKT